MSDEFAKKTGHLECKIVYKSTFYGMSVYTDLSIKKTAITTTTRTEAKITKTETNLYTFRKVRSASSLTVVNCYFRYGKTADVIYETVSVQFSFGIS